MTNDLSSILAVCLAAIEQRSSSIEECAAQYPKQRKELLQLLPLAATLRTAPIVAPSREFQVTARRRLLARLPAYQTPQKSSSLWPVISQWLTPRQRVLTRLVIAFTVLILFSTSVIAASAQALPNDWLYPAKLTLEQARLALAFTVQQRSELHLHFVEERLGEVQRLIEIGRSADAAPAIADLANQLEAATQSLSNMPDSAALLTELNDAIDRSENFLDQSADQLPASTQGAIQHTRGVLRTIPRSEPKRSEPQPTISVPSVTPMPTPTQVPPTPRPTRRVMTPLPTWPTPGRPWPITPTTHLPPWPWPTPRATPPFTWPTFTPHPHIWPTGVFTWSTFTSPTFNPPTFRPPTITPWPWPTPRATPPFTWPTPTPFPHIRPTGVFIRPTSTPPPFNPPTFVSATPIHPLASFERWHLLSPSKSKSFGRFPR